MSFVKAMQGEVPVSADIVLQVKPEAARVMELGIGFFAGASYGLTSVIVGQPLDTVKTRMQARPDSLLGGSIRVGFDLVRAQGLRALYRGGMPIACGGTLFRSAQFGVYEVALSRLQAYTPAHKLFGFLDWQVATAGIAGGVARGLIEAPFDYIKVSRQVERSWSWSMLYRGAGVTILRNSALFGCFSIYRDVIPPLIPGGLSPFWMGALSSNLAWVTVWPLDVIKSQKQSGNYQGYTALALLKEASRTGLLFRGVIPGLLRSTLANGCGMVAYKRVEEFSGTQLQRWR